MNYVKYGYSSSRTPSPTNLEHEDRQNATWEKNREEGLRSNAVGNIRKSFNEETDLSYYKNTSEYLLFLAKFNGDLKDHLKSHQDDGGFWDIVSSAIRSETNRVFKEREEDEIKNECSDILKNKTQGWVFV